MIRRLQELIARKDKMIESLASRMNTQLKVKQNECVNASEKLKQAKKELTTLKKHGVKTEGERISELEEKIKLQLELNNELTKELRSLKQQ